MPQYNFLCKACGKAKKVSRKPEQANDPVTCECGTTMTRNPSGATSRIVETRDNGLMSRRVEQLADIERINWERAHQDEEKFRKP